MLKILNSLLMISLLVACSKAPEQTSKIASYQWPIIEGFPKPQVPRTNPMSTEKVALGRELFYDVNLSFNKTQSCASCHIQSHAFAEPLTVSIGSTGQQHRRNAPALVNIAYNKTLTWAHDGLTTLERQILLPMFGEQPIELGITGHDVEVLQRFDTLRYRELFVQAFYGKAPSYELIVKALSSFIRSLISLDSPFDRYAYLGDDNAISTSALRGMNLFFSEKLECHHCHGGFNFTQSTSHEKQLIDRRPFHNTGLYNVIDPTNAENMQAGIGGYPKLDIGLAEISQKSEDNGRFRAPTLRNIAVSAPYMHDGSIESLGAVLDFYAAGGREISKGINQGDGRKNKYKSVFIKGFKMTEQDKKDLLAFLHTLTDNSFLTNPAFKRP